MAYADNYFAGTLGGQDTEWPEGWDELFGMGSEPKPDASAYPPIAEVRAILEKNRTLLLEWLGGLSEDDLEKPLPEGLAGFAPNFGALIGSLAVHEAMHVGQITLIRKALQLPRVLG